MICEWRVSQLGKSIDVICDYGIKKKGDEVERADKVIVLNIIVIKRDICV